MRIGIAGASGLIGRHLYQHLRKIGCDVMGTCYTHPQEGMTRFDITSDNFGIFDHCTHVVLSSAVTSIDECCIEHERACRTNVTKTRDLIDHLVYRNIIPVFLSSDQVFDGERGNYTECDPTSPINQYGRFKACVEDHLSSINQCIVLRLGKTYSPDLGVQSLYKEIYERLNQGGKVQAAFNQIYNLSTLEFTSSAIYQAMAAGLTGRYHLAEKVIMSRYEFALSIARSHGFDTELVESIDINLIGLKERRPLNTSLDVTKLSRELSLGGLNEKSP
jgi:dTDP-4-dehydrorhamnose reductase